MSPIARPPTILVSVVVFPDTTIAGPPRLLMTPELITAALLFPSVTTPPLTDPELFDVALFVALVSMSPVLRPELVAVALPPVSANVSMSPMLLPELVTVALPPFCVVALRAPLFVPELFTVAFTAAGRFREQTVGPSGIAHGVILVCVPELVQVTPAGVVGHGVTNCVLDEDATAQQIGGGCSVLSNCFPHCAWRQASL